MQGMEHRMTTMVKDMRHQWNKEMEYYPVSLTTKEWIHWKGLTFNRTNQITM
jgi:hypothetical protein